MSLIHLRLHKNDHYSFEQVLSFVTDYAVVRKIKNIKKTVFGDVGVVVQPEIKLCVLKLAVREQGEREHIHCIIQCTKTLSTFRQHFIVVFPLLLGNGAYSMAPVEKPESIEKYLLKGKQNELPDIMYAGEYSSTQVKKLHDDYWSHESKPGEKGKPVKLTFMQEVCIEVRNKYPNRLFSYDATDLTDISAILLKRMGKSAKILDVHIYRRMTLGILNSLNPSNLNTVLFSQAFPDLFGPTEY